MTLVQYVNNLLRGIDDLSDYRIKSNISRLDSRIRELSIKYFNDMALSKLISIKDCYDRMKDLYNAKFKSNPCLPFDKNYPVIQRIIQEKTQKSPSFTILNQGTAEDLEEALPNEPPPKRQKITRSSSRQPPPQTIKPKTTLKSRFPICSKAEWDRRVERTIKKQQEEKSISFIEVRACQKKSKNQKRSDPSHVVADCEYLLKDQKIVDFLEDPNNFTSTGEKNDSKLWKRRDHLSVRLAAFENLVNQISKSRPLLSSFIEVVEQLLFPRAVAHMDRLRLIVPYLSSNELGLNEDQMKGLQDDFLSLADQARKLWKGGKWEGPFFKSNRGLQLVDQYTFESRLKSKKQTLVDIHFLCTVDRLSLLRYGVAQWEKEKKKDLDELILYHKLQRLGMASSMQPKLVLESVIPILKWQQENQANEASHFVIFDPSLGWGGRQVGILALADAMGTEFEKKMENDPAMTAFASLYQEKKLSFDINIAEEVANELIKANENTANWSSVAAERLIRDRPDLNEKEKGIARSGFETLFSQFPLIEYIGMDPQKSVVQGAEDRFLFLQNQASTAASTEHFQQKLSATVAEDPKNWSDSLGKRKVDLIFTSPPYFDTERYHAENNEKQSHQYIEKRMSRSKKDKAWISKFLRPMIQNGANALKPGGFMAINVFEKRNLATITYQEAIKAGLEPIGQRILHLGGKSKEPLLVFRKNGATSSMSHFQINLQPMTLSTTSSSSNSSSK